MSFKLVSFFTFIRYRREIAVALSVVYKIAGKIELHNRPTTSYCRETTVRVCSAMWYELTGYGTTVLLSQLTVCQELHLDPKHCSAVPLKDLLKLIPPRIFQEMRFLSQRKRMRNYERHRFLFTPPYPLPPAGRRTGPSDDGTGSYTVLELESLVTTDDDIATRTLVLDILQRVDETRNIRTYAASAATDRQAIQSLNPLMLTVAIWGQQL